MKILAVDVQADCVVSGEFDAGHPPEVVEREIDAAGHRAVAEVEVRKHGFPSVGLRCPERGVVHRSVNARGVLRGKSLD